MNPAVVLMAYGSPERLGDVPAYYADIRGGRPIAREHLDDLVDRYRRLGIEDSNPLNAVTEATRAALERELELSVFTGMKHWTPRVSDAVERALAGGADTIVGLILAPLDEAATLEIVEQADQCRTLDGERRGEFLLADPAAQLADVGERPPRRVGQAIGTQFGVDGLTQAPGNAGDAEAEIDVLGGHPKKDRTLIIYLASVGCQAFCLSNRRRSSPLAASSVLRRLADRLARPAAFGRPLQRAGDGARAALAELALVERERMALARDPGRPFLPGTGWLSHES